MKIMMRVVIQSTSFFSQLTYFHTNNLAIHKHNPIHLIQHRNYKDWDQLQFLQQS